MKSLPNKKPSLLQNMLRWSKSVYSPLRGSGLAYSQYFTDVAYGIPVESFEIVKKQDSY